MEEKLLEAEKLVEEFCTKFEELYGKNNLTPNMHLAAHLTDCIRNHGPVYGFWLFAFERMNGIAGSFHTNTHNIPIQIMRKLTSMQSTDSSLWPSEFQNEFSSLLHEHKKGTLSDFRFLDKNEIKPLRPIFQKVLDEIELERIHQVLYTTYDGNNYHIVRLHKYTNAIVNGAIKLASEKSRYGNSSKVIVNNQLVEIIRFVYCTVIVILLLTETHRLWLA